MHAVQLTCKSADPHITHRLEISTMIRNQRWTAIFANTSPLISTTGINRGLDHVKRVEVLVCRSSPVRKLASTHRNYNYGHRNYAVITVTITITLR